jgi:S-adenosylmethionine synthetase
MKRYSEAVLNGHPDKFCDLLTDRILLELCRRDPNAYAQIEAAVWNDVIVLTGIAISVHVTSLPVREIALHLAQEIGYADSHSLRSPNLRIANHMSWIEGDSLPPGSQALDQCIVTGYAGYDVRTHYLPPEHFLAWHLREALIRSCAGGILAGQGPDGKVLAVMTEDHGGWKPETLLVTLQHQPQRSPVALRQARRK